MNIAALARLTNAVSDYENAFRVYALAHGIDRDEASDEMIAACRRLNKAEAELGEDGPVIRRALVMASARVSHPRDPRHADHLTDAYTARFIGDWQS